MPNINVSKDLIVNIAEQENTKYIKTVNKSINQIIGQAIKDLSEKISFVSLKNVILQPANELISGAFIDASLFIYLLGVQNPQLELNTNQKESAWKSFKDRVVWAWNNRKRFIKRKKKHRKSKKSKEIETLDNDYKFEPNTYTIYQLTEDLQKAMIQYLCETSMVYMNDNVLQIVGKDDFGANTKIVIYVVNYDGEKFKYYAGKKEGFKLIDIDSRLKCLENKIMTVGENFIKILKVFNSLYYNINGIMCNQIFMESILCSCPEDLFFGDDIYKVFVKIVNYLSIKTLKDIKSINNSQLTIFKDEICGNCGLGFNKMLSKILKN